MTNPCQAADDHPYAMPPRGIQGWPVERVSTNAGDIWFPIEDKVMREHARHSGHWDVDVGNVLLRAVGSRENLTFLDIGANVGYFSCLLAQHSTSLRTLAFEPQPLVSDLLRLNTWVYADRIKVYGCALGESRGVLGLRSSVNNLGDTRGVGDSIAEMLAPLVSLDELCPQLHADVVKIDVQGAELNVLRGMAGVIKRSPGIQIVVEYSPHLAREEYLDPAVVLDAYRAFGLKLLVIKGDVLEEMTNSGIMRYCSSAGPEGQVNLLLVRG